MKDTEYKLQFEELCNTVQLGEITCVPEAISGGLLHKMYVFQTTKGKYAIKALNPQIMLRPTAMQNFINSERIANIAANNVPALSAKEVNGTFMHKIADQFYLIFDWIDGECLKSNEIDVVHCEKMGAILADIHMTDFSELGTNKGYSGNTLLTDWNYYLQKGQQINSIWLNLLREYLYKLYDWNKMANESTKLLESDMVISHKDLEPKNVMWKQGNPILIDWESAGYINPMQDLTETAIYWSANEIGNIDKERFLAFIAGYKTKYGTLQANWRMVLVNGFLGKLDWLEYSLKRSLWIECTDEEEQQMGTSQVTETINTIICYADMISEIEKWLDEVDNIQ
ncbi:membrane protein [Paenibacillus albidus]|uniref:Membrane protein n=1 Tax=Paenibacillus albidus TaxID=2041023 RepID=A0A917LCR1_9BACL|nr:phosphotransferase [Paenibacillus albidus]GGG14052.1 membrane protein [Paenibacillus albidus]